MKELASYSCRTRMHVVRLEAKMGGAMTVQVMLQFWVTACTNGAF